MLTSKEINQIGEDCLKETGMKRDLVVYYRDTLKFSKHDKKYMTFLTCSYKKQGYQDADGEIIFETLAEFLEQFYTKEQVTGVLDACKTVKGKNAGENAFFVMQCIIENLNSLEATMAQKSN